MKIFLEFASEGDSRFGDGFLYNVASFDRWSEFSKGSLTETHWKERGICDIAK